MCMSDLPNKLFSMFLSRNKLVQFMSITMYGVRRKIMVGFLLLIVICYLLFKLFSRKEKVTQTQISGDNCTQIQISTESTKTSITKKN